MQQWCRLLSIIAAGIVAISVTACSLAPSMDGGIVGTGNRVDCEKQAKKNETPEECGRETR
jgi:hypothetical protein